MSQIDQNQPGYLQAASLEQQQEELLKAKYPNLKPKSGSSFLQKRMSHNKKYFDSGDYNMARAQIANKEKLPPEVPQLAEVTGNLMPTPDEMPRERKMSQSSLVMPDMKTS